MSARLSTRPHEQQTQHRPVKREAEPPQCARGGALVKKQGMLRQQEFTLWHHHQGALFERRAELEAGHVVLR